LADFNYSYLLYAIDIVVKLSKLVVAQHAPSYYSHTEFSVCFKLQSRIHCIINMD